MNIYEFDIIAEEDEIYDFNETTVYNNERKKLYIAVHPDDLRDLQKGPYFKVSWQSNFSDNSKVARLSMQDSKKDFYIIHNNSTALVNNKITKEINKALKAKCQDDNKANKIKKRIDSELKSRDDMSEEEKDSMRNKKITTWDALLYDIYDATNSDSLVDLEKKYEPIEYNNLKIPSNKSPRTNKWGE